MNIRTIISGLLIAVFASFFFTNVSLAHETTPEHAEEHMVETLLAQIQELLALVQNLQQQIAAIQGGADPTAGFFSDLTIGDENFQVVALQRILNQDPRTRIASSGPGSPGNETSYYGYLTADAVARFQELYRGEILTPNGLTEGTGYFGPSTRAKMNEIARKLATETVEQTEDVVGTLPPSNPVTTPPETEDPALDLGVLTPPPPTVESNTVTESVTGGASLNISGGLLDVNYETYDGFSVGEASNYAAAPGETILLRGTQLTNGTKIFFGDTVVKGNGSADGSTLTFIVPNIEKGPYELTFESVSGEKALRIMDFVITNQNATAPEIFVISPSIGPDGSQVTIYGSGFTPTGNQVEFGSNVVANVPSPDGKSLSVTVDSGLDIGSNAQESQSGVAEWPLFIYVANANGRVAEPSLFVIKN